MNFIGFDEIRGNGTAPVLFNRVVILPPPRETAGKWIHPAAGFVPGQQPYIKPQVQIYNRSLYQVNKRPRSRDSGKSLGRIIKDPVETPPVLVASLSA